MTAMMSLMLGVFGLGTAFMDATDQKEGLLAAERVFKAIDDAASSSIDGLSTIGGKPGHKCSGLIELRDVSFCYPTRKDVQIFNKFNITIKAGETVAFVGSSGSGKSTIMNLLLRFYDPQKGTVFLDGVDIKDLNVRWLRSQFGYVGQEPVLFSGTVSENIALGRDPNQGEFAPVSLQETIDEFNRRLICGTCAVPNVKPSDPSAPADVESQGQPESAAVDRDIIDATKSSNAHEFISSFSEGYDTNVGSSGNSLISGGQKQRIAIARALLKRPNILLLDEATSALDSASERVVQQAIDQLQASKAHTTIVIAHRLSTIRNADKIAVVDNGAVAEIGTHDELMAKAGLYKELWRKQQESGQK